MCHLIIPQGIIIKGLSFDLHFNWFNTHTKDVVTGGKRIEGDEPYVHVFGKSTFGLERFEERLENFTIFLRHWALHSLTLFTDYYNFRWQILTAPHIQSFAWSFL